MSLELREIGQIFAGVLISAVFWWLGYSFQRNWRDIRFGVIRIHRTLQIVFGNPRADGTIQYYGACWQIYGFALLVSIIWLAVSGNLRLAGMVAVGLMFVAGFAIVLASLILLLLRLFR